MTGFLEAVLIILLVVAALGAIVVWAGLRLVRRTVALGRRRALEFRARLLPPGPRRDAAALRHQLAAELHAMQQAIAAAPPGARMFRADPVAVLAEATRIATRLDADLATIETFLDRARQRTALATVTPQVVQLIDSIYSARQTVLQTAALDRERDLSVLGSAVADEAASLRNYEQNRRDLTI
ncbi:MAG TPA: hypothetical protein VGN18_10725 [Jatrophihabitans sp.]|jgi:hypothetical protein|uniref:hypothetical protein n=1 Tax=Jatrophihabitans sp. TaxID=1932789 RepID=UPI002E0C7DC1|nr:hypothetical protein [Jatrophihabitans sp.]